MCTEQPYKGLYEQTEKNWRQIRVKKYRREKKKTDDDRERTDGAKKGVALFADTRKKGKVRTREG